MPLSAELNAARRHGPSSRDSTALLSAALPSRATNPAKPMPPAAAVAPPAPAAALTVPCAAPPLLPGGAPLPPLLLVRCTWTVPLAPRPSSCTRQCGGRT